MNACCPTRLMVALAMLAVAAAAPPASSNVNLLTNPGFEDFGGSFNGWTAFGNAYISTPADENIFRSGAAAAKAFGNFTNCPIPVFNVSGFFQSFTPTPGQVYELSGYGYVSSTDAFPAGSDVCSGNRCTAKIVFYDALNDEIASNEIIVADVNTSHDEWIEFSVSAPAPASAVRVEALILFLQPGCDPGATFIDDLSFCELSPPAPLPNVLANPGFDTSLTGWTPFETVFHEPRPFAVRTPPGSAKLFGPFSEPGATSGLFQSFPTTPGEGWLLQVWSFHSCQHAFEQEPPIGPADPSFATAKIVFRDGGGAEIGFNEVVIADASKPLETWSPHIVNAIAPPGAVTVEAFLIFIHTDGVSQGNVWVDDVVFGPDVSTSTPPGGVFALPGVDDVQLRQNVPNPFRPSTRIEFVVGREAPVELSVYDVAGRHVKTLVEKRFTPGTYGAAWDGTTRSGKPAAAGVYRYVLRTPQGRISRSMLLVR